ncbi:MAG: lipopolysaccharide biosynthesis protein [Hyphomonas sp.]
MTEPHGANPESPERRPTRQERNDRTMSTDHLQDDLGRRTISGGGLFVASHVVKLVIQFGTMAVLGRLLLPDDFGLMAICWAVLGFVSMFADLGLGTATIQRKEIDQNTTSVLFFTGIGVGILVAAVVAALAPGAAALFDDDRLLLVVPATALTLPISMLSIQHFALMNRTMRWMDLQVAAVGSQAVGAVTAILLALFTPIGYWALVAQAWASALVYSGYLILKCDWRPSIPHDWLAAWSSVKLGLNLTGFMFLNYFHRQFDNVLIGWRWGTVELGYYARAYALLLAPINFVNGPIGSVIEPALSRLQDRPEQWRRAYLDGLAVVVLIGGALTATLFGGAKPIIETVYGPQWTETIDIFGMLALSMLFGTPMSSTGWIYVSLGRTARMFRWAMIATPVYIASFVIGLPYGAIGVATGYSIASALLFLPCLVMAVHNTPVSLADTLKVILPTSLCCAVIGLVLHWMTPQTGVLVGLFLTGLGLAIYLSVAALLLIYWPPFASLKGHTLKTLEPLKQRALQAFRSRRA